MTYDIEWSERPEQLTAVVRDDVPVTEIAAFLGDAFGEVMAALMAAGSGPVGPPFARYDMADVTADPGPEVFRVEAGFPVAQAVPPQGRVVEGVLPGGPAAMTVHAGAYDQVAAAYQALDRWIADQGATPTGAPWESYLDDPGEVDTPHTEVVWPCSP